MFSNLIMKWAIQHKKSAAVGHKAPYPGFIQPALATAVEKVPSGTRWPP
jgi:bifunctional non-homologous end joining protein LigD